MKTFIDLTDIFHFMRYAKNVTGIQRCTLLMVEALLQQPGNTDLRFIAYHPVFKCMVEFDHTWLRAVRGKSAEDFIHQYSLKANWQSLRELAAVKLGRRLSQTASGPNWRRPRPAAGDKICVLGNYWGYSGLYRFLLQQARRGVRVESVIYDLIPLLFPQFSPKSFNQLYRKRLLGLSAVISRYLAISECTAGDLNSFLNKYGTKPIPPVSVLPLAQEFPAWLDSGVGVSAIRPMIEDIASRPFVLCVGTIEKRKNQTLLARVWAKLYSERGADMPRLLLLGKYGWFVESLREQLKSDKSFAIVSQISDASDAELAYLYERCLFTAYPSLYEGWGLPVGESLWFGKTCLASSTSSIPEVGGEMCAYVDPQDAADLYDTISTLVFSGDLRSSLERRIAQTRLRTWADVGADLAKLITHESSIEETNQIVS